MNCSLKREIFNASDFTGEDWESDSNSEDSLMPTYNSISKFNMADFTGDNSSSSETSASTKAETSSPSMASDIDIGPEDDEEIRDPSPRKTRSAGLYIPGQASGSAFVIPQSSPVSSPATSFVAGMYSKYSIKVILLNTPGHTGRSSGFALHIPQSVHSPFQQTSANETSLPNLSNLQGRWALTDGLNIPGMNLRTTRPTQCHLQSFNMTIEYLRIAERRIQAEIAAALCNVVSLRAELDLIDYIERGNIDEARVAGEELESAISRQDILDRLNEE